MATKITRVTTDTDTDTDLAHEKSVLSINLSYCKKITDAGLVNLKGMEVINLNGCSPSPEQMKTESKRLEIHRKTTELLLCSNNM